MTDFTESHDPSPAFYARTESEMIEAFRRQSRFAPDAPTRRPRLARIGAIAATALLMLGVGLVWGANTGFASADLVDAREREVMSGNVWATREFARGRLEQARANYERTRQAFEKHAASRASLDADELAVREMETVIARIDDDLKRSRASESATRSPFAILQNSPVRSAIATLTCRAPAAAAAPVQQGVPIVDLPTPTVKTAAPLGTILGLREVPGGKLLVNDATHHQIRLLDSALTTIAVPIDSTPGLSTSYGTRPLPLLRYLGDSSLTADIEAGTMLMLDPAGAITRAVAPPFTQSLPAYADLGVVMGNRSAAVDNRGRILLQWPRPMLSPQTTVAERVAGISRDTVAVVRADLDTRRVDTLTFIKHGGTTALMGRSAPDQPVLFTRMPIETVDVWGVLSDGSVGVVRGQDYHIDWFLPDGTKRSTTKLPFDWKRVTDDDKQHMIDSITALTEQQAAAIRARPPVPTDPNPPNGGQPGARVQQPPGQPRGPQFPMKYVPPALKDIPDYYPSVRLGAAMPDMDGNLWILPTSSAQSRHGELIYDVVNPKGDFRRVRLPEGRSIAGFGKGGVVFLQSGNRTSGFILERTRLPLSK